VAAISQPPAQAGESSTRYVLCKLPHITLLFWVLKIVATTLGETGGDLIAQTLKWDTWSAR
jgi:uncharacterized membrane-anchored protein